MTYLGGIIIESLCLQCRQIAIALQTEIIGWKGQQDAVHNLLKTSQEPLVLMQTAGSWEMLCKKNSLICEGKSVEVGIPRQVAFACRLP